MCIKELTTLLKFSFTQVISCVIYSHIFFIVIKRHNLINVAIFRADLTSENLDVIFSASTNENLMRLLNLTLTIFINQTKE